MKTRSDAKQLLEEWVQSESLRRHCLSVAISMEAYARKYVEDGKLGNSPTRTLSSDSSLPTRSSAEIVNSKSSPTPKILMIITSRLIAV
ncbi:MAG: hypothetical protein IH934_05995 [Nanoarchaeota archaeon]|nr:hypothetical protein [Nanoarchaeota archaeon]